MTRRWVGWAAWLMLAACLYFFENNTGTRAVLLCSLLCPLVPPLRSAFFSPDRLKQTETPKPLTVSSLVLREAEEPGDVRAYLPGDPVNRIHWKLSAKRDELLVRPQTLETAEEKTKAEETGPGEEKRSRSKRLAALSLAVALLSLLLLLLIPEANRGAQALCNRLFSASEAVNAYAYDRFSVSENQPVWPAVLLLSVMLTGMMGVLIASRSRLLALTLMGGCAAFQAYFGLPLPGWANVGLLILFALWMARRPWTRKEARILLSGVLAVSLSVALIWPGVDTGTEAASERTRDWLNRLAQQAMGTVREEPTRENEVRHVHTQTLITGEGEAKAEREYRLVTLEEQQISMPHWVDYLKIALLLLLTVALVVLPFLPFLWLNARRKRALEALQVFRSDDLNEAVFAMFQHIAAWLVAMGYGAGNVLYRDWQEHLETLLPPDYAERFGQSAKIFEEAAYSGHEMTEEQRETVRRFLEETEAVMRAKADWKQKLRLKYKEGLWL